MRAMRAMCARRESATYVLRAGDYAGQGRRDDL
jgi:hypothetical protein